MYKLIFTLIMVTNNENISFMYNNDIIFENEITCNTQGLTIKENLIKIVNTTNSIVGWECLKIN